MVDQPIHSRNKLVGVIGETIMDGHEQHPPFPTMPSSMAWKMAEEIATRLEQNGVKLDTLQAERQKRGVALQKGAQLAAFLFVTSFYFWFVGETILINPFVSFIGLVACPFFWAMGKMMQENALPPRLQRDLF